jgi:hypothetical protein
VCGGFNFVETTTHPTLKGLAAKPPASKQAVMLLRETRVLLLRSKKWTKASVLALSTGVTCGGLCLRTAKDARWRVPAHSGVGVWFFRRSRKNHTPTPKGV